ncbi:uncharacterized protein LODBEIA_P06870 [Lodderomyces beijingensis]|uniref:ER membrane protein complex subunit 7 beta-sandwich domain-containing protein n=1 Tax=Lodderomyces beijingensis TaxID=1775926 RepID=A0ABP0ZE81_9ASCO
MMKLSLAVLSLLHVFTFASAIGFRGVLKPIPAEVAELSKELNHEVVNINNYAQRIKVDLYNLSGGGKKNTIVKPLRAVVTKDYNFKFDRLHQGEYELVVNSYDFTFDKSKFRIIIDDQGTVTAYDFPLGQEHFNTTSGVVVSRDRPLQLQFKDVKQFYEKSGGTLKDMVINSPLGFIFKNTTYTIIFVACLAIMAAPYILQWVNPELAAELNDARVKVADDRIEKKPVSDYQPAAVGESSVRTGAKNIKKRR